MSQRSFGPYQAVSELGHGSTAVVYEVVHLVSGQHFALKHLLDPMEFSLLKREFRLARSLIHPNLVRLNELAQVDDQVFFTMELVRGRDLVSHLRRPPDVAPSSALVVEVFGQLAAAVDHVHHAAFVHRDLKPANILVEPTGRVVLLDFGLVRPISSAPRLAFSGSPLYAAPERFMGVAASRASDWYSFGVVLLEALVGDVPPDLLRLALRGERPDLSGLKVDDHGLAALVHGLLDPDPATRAGRSDVLLALGVRGSVAGSVGVRGRDPEQRWLQEALARPGLVALVGDSGTGKTALVTEVLRQVRDRPILRSRCHPRENIPFNALDGVWMGLEELRAPDAEPAPPPRELADLGDQLARGLALLEATPILWIDDAQWADDDSVTILEDVLARDDLSLTVVLTVRGSPSDLPSAIRPAPEDVRWLRSMSDDASRDLLSRLAPGLAEDLADALLVLAAGRPLWIEQAATWTRHRPGAPAPPRPADLFVDATVRGPPGNRDLMGLLAAHPQGLDLDVIEACDGAFVGPGWDLLDAGLVEFERAPRGYRVCVRHAQVAEAVWGDASGEERVAWHARLADAFRRVREADHDARFVHLVGSHQEGPAGEQALLSARHASERLALHRAAERYRWLISHQGPILAAEARRELASVLSRAGEGAEAAAELQTLAATSGDERERWALRRLAAEQLLRSGHAEEGRALLASCLVAVGLWFPSGNLTRLALALWHRLRIRVLLAFPSRLPADDRVLARLDAAWSAGLGLNLVDVMASSVAQGHFTALALVHGSPGHVARAVAVEYSFSMLVGSTATRSRSLRERMEGLLEVVSDPYDRGVTELSWAAGDLFRGHLGEVVERANRARACFATDLGPKSWEISNCEMYALWARLETTDLEATARHIDETLRRSTSRGDLSYRQCFAGGFCATGWLIQDRPDELRRLLDELPSPGVGFELPHFFRLVADHRLDLYLGQGRAAWERVQAWWPRVVRSGVLQVRWLRLQLAVVRVQAALASGADPAARAEATRWTRRIARIEHPTAGPWARALAAGASLERSGPGATAELLEDAATAFDAAGHLTTAAALRHQAGRLLGATPRWAVASPDALAEALSVPLGGISRPLRGP